MTYTLLKLQNDLNCVHQWIVDKKLSLNADKTKFIIIVSKQKLNLQCFGDINTRWCILNNSYCVMNMLTFYVTRHVPA